MLTRFAPQKTILFLWIKPFFLKSLIQKQVPGFRYLPRFIKNTGTLENTVWSPRGKAQVPRKYYIRRKRNNEMIYDEESEDKDGKGLRRPA